MTAQSSTRNKSRFLTYFLYRLGKLKYLTVLLTILSFFTYPYFLIVYDRYIRLLLGIDKDTNNMIRTLEMIARGTDMIIFVAAMLGCVIVSFVILLSGFRYLHSKRYVNMEMTLPITHTKRFFGDLLATFISVFVPHILAVVTGSAICSVMRSYDWEKLFPQAESSWTPSYYAWINTMESMMPMGIITFLLLFFMTLFVISTTGKKATAVVVPIAMQIVIPASVIFLRNISLFTAYGASDWIRASDTGILCVLSPLSFLLMYRSWDSILRDPWILAAIGVYLAGLCIGAYFLQKHRRTERTGEAFVYRYALHIYTGICVLGASAFFWFRIFCPSASVLWFGYDTDTPAMFYVTEWLIISLVIFVIAELIGGGKLKKLPFTALRYAATTGLCALICFGLAHSDGFGYATYIPDKNTAPRATIQLNNFVDNAQSYNVPYEDAVRLHKKIIDERPQPDSDLIELTIGYTSEEDGLVSERRYYLTREYTREIYELIYANKGFLGRSHSSMYYVPEMNDTITSVDTETGIFTEIEVNATDAYVFRYNYTGGVRDDSDITRYDIPVEKLCEAMQADAADVTFEQLYLSAYAGPENLNLRVIYEYNGPSNFEYQIYPFFERTVALLSEYGYDMFEENSEYKPAYIARKTKEVPYSVENSLSLFNYTNYVNDGGDGSFEVHTLEPDSEEYSKAISMTAERSFYTGNERYYIVFDEGDHQYKRLPIPEMYNDAARVIFESTPVDEQLSSNPAEAIGTGDT